MYEYVGAAHWSRTTVFDLAKWRNGLAFKNINFSESGRPVIKIAELKFGITDQTKFTNKEYDESVFVKKGDMLFSWSGNPDTSIDIFRWDGPEGWLNQHIYKVTPRECVNEDFLFFVLRWLKPRLAEIARNKQTTGLGHVTLQDFRDMAVGLPEEHEQRAIVSIVGPIQEKIELNRRTNETLEAMARALFKDWFVDFGPTRAKMGMRGEDPQKENIPREPYLAPDLWALFPDRLDDATGLPEGWELSEIGKEVEAVGGATPSTKESSFWNGGVHYWATPKDLSRLSNPILLDTERKITDIGLARISSGLLPIGTVLLSSRAPIGYLALAEVPVAVNQGFIAMKCTKRLSNLFVVHWCYERLEYIKCISGGSTFAEISKKAFRPIPVTVPSPAVRSAFDSIVQPLYADITANVREARTLARTRDLFLPKLMSGEIRLRDAENVAGEVA